MIQYGSLRSIICRVMVHSEEFLSRGVGWFPAGGSWAHVRPMSSLADLKKRVKDTRPSVRMAASRELATLSTPAAAQELRKLAFHDQSPEVRYEARRALEAHRLSCPPVVPCSKEQEIRSREGFRTSLMAAEPSRRVAAAFWLVQNPFPEGVSQLLDALPRERDPEVRASMACALGRMGGWTHLSCLDQLLADSDARVRANALEALVYLQSPHVYVVAIKYLKDADHRVKATAARLLHCAGRKGALQVLKRMLLSGQPAYVDSAAHALTVLAPGPEVVPLLVLAARSTWLPARNRGLAGLEKLSSAGDPQAREALARARTAVPNDQEEPVSPLVSPQTPEGLSKTDTMALVLQSGDAWTRKQAVVWAKESGDRDIAHILWLHVLKERDQSVRATIATALGQQGGLDCVERLLELLDDPNPRVVANAVQALGVLGDPSSFDDLYALWEYRNHRVRANVAVALWQRVGSSGTAGYEVRPILEALVRSPIPIERRAAQWVLTNRIEDQSLRNLLSRVETEIPRVAETSMISGSKSLVRTRTVRVFVSSTFEDMQAERDHLARVVFPRLKALCASQGIEFAGVDLRWGMSNQKPEDDLARALVAVEECHPFFIGLLGERYGPIPEEYVVSSAGDHDWVLREKPREHSTNALEILQAIQRAAKGVPGAFVYLRDPSFLWDARFLAEVPQSRGEGASRSSRTTQKDFWEPDPANAHKLEILKRKIVASGVPVMNGYPCTYGGLSRDGRVVLKGLGTPEGAAVELDSDSKPVRFGDRVAADLWGAIQSLVSKDGMPDWMAEREAHESVLLARAFAHVGGEAEKEALGKHSQRDGPQPIVVAAPPGGGKSALLSSWCQEHRRENPRDLLIAHFVGATPASTTSWGTVRRIAEELIHVLGLPMEFPRDPGQMSQAFWAVLSRACETRRIVIVIDGLDQLANESEGSDLSWLPERFPDHVRVVLSAAYGPSLDALKARRIDVVSMTPLSDAQLRKVARLVLAHDRQRLSESPIRDRRERRAVEEYLKPRLSTLPEPLRSKNLTEFSPLDLFVAKIWNLRPACWKMILEELRLMKEGFKVVPWLVAIPDDETDLFDTLLCGMERRLAKHRAVGFRRDLLGWALTVLDRSRHGLTDVELSELYEQEAKRPLPWGVWVRLLDWLKPCLLRVGPLLKIGASQFRKAVWRRKLLAKESSIHAALASLFRKKADPDGSGRFDGDEHALMELSFHLQKAEKWDDLFRLLTDWTYLEVKCARIGVLAVCRDLRDALDSRHLPDVGQQVLSGLLQVLERVADRLHARPDLFFQEIYNQGGFLDRPAGPLFLCLEGWRRRYEESGRVWLRSLRLLPTESSDAPSNASIDVSARKSDEPASDPRLAMRTAIRGRPDLDSSLLLGHEASVSCCVTTFDGFRAVTASEDGTLAVFDLTTGRRLMQFLGHRDQVRAAVVTRDADRVVSASLDHTLRVWNPNTGDCLRILEGHSDGVTTCSLSPDGRLVVSGSQDQTVRVWDVRTGSSLMTLEGHLDQVQFCAFTPDGRRIVSAAHDTLRVWDLETKNELFAIKAHLDAITACTLSPDGGLCVSGSADKTIKVWDLATGGERASMGGHSWLVKTCAIKPDASSLVSVSYEGVILVHDVRTGERLSELGTPTQWVRACSLTPDCRLLALAATDRTLRIWDLARGSCLSILLGNSPLSACALSQDGRHVVVGNSVGHVFILELVNMGQRAGSPA